MGSELVSTSTPWGGEETVLVPPTFYQIFDEHCPYYMAMGMSYEEYWDGDNELPKYYRQADKLKRKRQNQEMWLQGAYIYNAIAALSPILVTNLSKHPAKPLPYLDEPFPLDTKEAEERELRQKQEAAEKMKQKMLAFAKAFNARKEGNADERKHDRQSEPTDNG